MSTAPADETLNPADETLHSAEETLHPADGTADMADRTAIATGEPSAAAEEAEERAGAGAPRPGLSLAGRAFAIVAFLEAFTWAGLLIGMLLKYGTGTTEMGVFIFGRLHGGAFLIYLAVTFVAAWRQRWRWWVWLVALAAAIPPLVTVPLEIWLRRSGRLSPRADA